MTVQMNRASPSGLKDFFSKIWEYEDILKSPGSGDWILIPSHIQSVSYTFKVTGGSGKIQFTTDKIDVVKNGTPEPIDSDDGIVTTIATDVIFPVTAIRIVNIEGICKLTVRVQ